MSVRAAFESGGRPDVYAVFGRVWEANARAGALSRGSAVSSERAASVSSRAQRGILLASFRNRVTRFLAALGTTGRLTKYVVVHNNTFMKRAALPVILLNTVRSTGATG
jgi:hypothetical protein